jgi:hypothetical protein
MYRLTAVDEVGNRFQMTGTLIKCLKRGIHLHARLGMNCSIYRRWDGTEIRERPNRVPLP